MASNFITAFHCPNPHPSSSSSYSNLQQNTSLILKFHSRCSSSSRKFAVSEGAEGRVQDEELLISSSSGMHQLFTASSLFSCCLVIPSKL